VASFITQPTRGFIGAQMEVTGSTLREPIGRQPAKDPTETAAPRAWSPTSTACRSKMLGFRIAFDDGCPQYLSGENE